MPGSPSSRPSTAPCPRTAGSATISRNGDLFHGAWLEFDLTGVHPELDAYDLIKKVRIEVGGSNVDEQPGHYMKTYAELSSSKDERPVLKAMRTTLEHRPRVEYDGTKWEALDFNPVLSETKAFDSTVGDDTITIEMTSGGDIIPAGVSVTNESGAAVTPDDGEVRLLQKQSGIMRLSCWTRPISRSSSTTVLRGNPSLLKRAALM